MKFTHMIFIIYSSFSLIYSGYKLNSHLTCFWRGFQAQLVEHRTVSRRSVGSNHNYLLKLLHNCEDHFHLYSLSAVHSYDLCHVHIMSFSSYNRCKLNSHLTCFQRGFIAQSVARASHRYRWSLRIFIWALFLTA